jgi:membrane protein
LAFGGGLALLYRYGPSREHARWRWVSWGSVAATVLWLAASLLFSLYTSKFSHYDRTYGSLGAVVGLMIWVWFSAIIVLLGAELNGEIERQVGNPAPAA